jgi:deoxyribonucleoside regulator
MRLATILGENLGAKTYHLPVPALVASVAVKEILLDDPSVRAGLEIARAASAALVGIGRVAYESSIVAAEFFDRTMVDDLKAKGAVGDMVCRSFDVYGRPIVLDFDDRLISLTLDDIRKIKPVIAVGGGIVKASAVLGALRTACSDILITDEQTARKVLSLDTAIPLPGSASASP